MKFSLCVCCGLMENSASFWKLLVLRRQQSFVIYCDKKENTAQMRDDYLILHHFLIIFNLSPLPPTHNFHIHFYSLLPSAQPRCNSKIIWFSWIFFLGMGNFYNYANIMPECHDKTYNKFIITGRVMHLFCVCKPKVTKVFTRNAQCS